VLTDVVGPSAGLAALQAGAPLAVGAVLANRDSGNVRLLGYAMLAAGAGFLLSFLWNRLRRWRFGTCKLLVRDFPARPGGPLRVVFRGGQRLRESSIDVLLQCVAAEHRVTYAQNRGSSVSSYRIYQEERQERTDAQGDAALEFTLPDDIPGTRLQVGSGETAVYWRLLVAAQLTGLDYGGEFLLPVYDG
jgi:hypothetical protein